MSVTADELKQASAACDVLRGVLGDALLAVYLHGSAVSGGLRPQSDVDLIAVIERRMADGERRALLAALLALSGPHPAPPGGPRCLEVMIFVKADLASPAFPARVEFLYGEWLRDAFETGVLPGPSYDAENTLVLAQAHREAMTLLGPDARTHLPEIPAKHVRRAMREALPALLASLEGDERNVLLTLARMWRTAALGDFVAKDVAAAWAAPMMAAGEAETLLLARDGYIGKAKDVWLDRREAARRAADAMSMEVFALLEPD